MSKIFVTRPIPGSATKMLRERGHTVEVNPKDKPLSKRELLKELSRVSYDGVLCLLYDAIDKEVFDAAPSVKIYANYAVGFNNIDTEEAKRRGIAVTNTPSDAVNESVAEHVFALLLALSHRITEGDSFMRSGKYTGWNPNLLIGADIKGKTLGVIGAGRIGTYVLQKAVQGFGMKAVYFDVIRNERAEREYGAVFLSSAEEVLQVADVITLHVLLNESTKHLISEERLARMKPTAVIVNTSRGAVIDEQALFDALNKGALAGAALDVYENEPKVARGLLKLRNVVLTPHIASATEGARDDMSRIAAQNLIDFFDGKQPSNMVK